MISAKTNHDGVFYRELTGKGFPNASTGWHGYVVKHHVNDHIKT